MLGCGNHPATLNNSETLENDSCNTAIVFPNAQMSERMVNSDYTGDLNNYMGEDTSRLDIKHTFKNGALIRSKFYYKNGQVYEEYNFKCQSLHGDVKTFYESGQIFKRIPFRYGRMEGVALVYDSLGTIRQKAYYKNDSIVGERLVHDEKGNLISGSK